MNEHVLLDNYRELASEILTTAITDFTYLRGITAIREDFSVNPSFWKRSGYGNYAKPIGISSPQDARELVWFLQSPILDKLCAFIGVPACQVRSRIGLQSQQVAADPFRAPDNPNLRISDKASTLLQKP